jgi:hypothetical protein
LAEWADEWSKVTSKEFRVGATKLVDLVRDALVTGYPDHVVMMAKRIRSRHLAEWGRLCRSARYALRTDTPILSEEQIQGRRLFAASLIEDLTRIDGRAEKFKADQVIEVANNKKMTTDAGFAGKLACMCGALEYKSGDQEKAQEAFRHALRGRRPTPNDVSG